MNLEFDANNIKTTSRTSDYFHLEIETEYEGEVLDNFKPTDIVDNYYNLPALSNVVINRLTPIQIVEDYDRLEELFEELKKQFEK
jgi:hypothetical protein